MFSVSTICFTQRKQQQFTLPFQSVLRPFISGCKKAIPKCTPERRGGTEHKENCRASGAKEWDLYVISWDHCLLSWGLPSGCWMKAATTYKLPSAKMGQARHYLANTLLERLSLRGDSATPVHIITSSSLPLYFVLIFLDLVVLIYAASEVWSENIKIPLAGFFFMSIHHFSTSCSASCSSEKHALKYEKQKREEDLFMYLAIHLVCR